MSEPRDVPPGDLGEWDIEERDRHLDVLLVEDDLVPDPTIPTVEADQ